MSLSIPFNSRSLPFLCQELSLKSLSLKSLFLIYFLAMEWNPMRQFMKLGYYAKKGNKFHWTCMYISLASAYYSSFLLAQLQQSTLSRNKSFTHSIQCILYRHIFRVQARPLSYGLVFTDVQLPYAVVWDQGRYFNTIYHGIYFLIGACSHVYGHEHYICICRMKGESFWRFRGFNLACFHLYFSNLTQPPLWLCRKKLPQLLWRKVYKAVMIRAITCKSIHKTYFRSLFPLS